MSDETIHDWKYANAHYPDVTHDQLYVMNLMRQYDGMSLHTEHLLKEYIKATPEALVDEARKLQIELAAATERLENIQQWFDNDTDDGPMLKRYCDEGWPWRLTMTDDQYDELRALIYPIPPTTDKG